MKTAENGWKQLQMLKIVETGWKELKTVENNLKQVKKQFKLVDNGWQRLKR